MTKKYKKKQDNFLRNVIIFFGTLIGVLMAVLIYFNLTALKYDDFEQVGTYDAVAQMPEDTYLVYFYSITCGACTNIKEQILEFADENVEGLKVYLLSAETTQELISGSRGFIVGPNGEELRYTPTLMLYVDGEMTRFMQGGDSIIDFIEEVQNGEFSGE